MIKSECCPYCGKEAVKTVQLRFTPTPGVMDETEYILNENNEWEHIEEVSLCKFHLVYLSDFIIIDGKGETVG